MTHHLDKFILNTDCSLMQAMVTMDSAGEGFVAVCLADRKIDGIVTDGDVRRALLQGIDLQAPVSAVYNKDFIHVDKDQVTDALVRNLFETTSARHLPICDQGVLVDIIFEERYMRGEQKLFIPQITEPIPVVIMAGGKGTRMAPFTNVLPKPLIPIGNRTMIEVIMAEYAKFGLSEFHISVHHQSRIIKAYFEEKQPRYNISFIEEETPLGTAGAIKLIEEDIKSDFFVSNCDVLIHADYSEIYAFHSAGGYDLTIVTSMQHHTVPYGVCETDGEGNLIKIEEKPKYDFLINTGMYLLNPRTLEHIPERTFYHLTHLIKDLMGVGKKIGVFSVPEKAYVDVGQWNEYHDAVQFLGIN